MSINATARLAPFGRELGGGLGTLYILNLAVSLRGVPLAL